MVVGNMSRIAWLAIQYVAAFDFALKVQYGNLPKYPGELSLRIGDVLNAIGIHIGCETSDSPMGQVWSSSSVRLCSHHKAPSAEFPFHSLEEAIAAAVYEQVLCDDFLRRLLVERAPSLDTFGKTFEPVCWNGKAVRIPVGHVRLHEFRRRNENGSVCCSIELGDYVHLSAQEILGTCFEQPTAHYWLNRSTLLHQGLAEIVDKILANQHVVAFLRQSSFPFELNQEGFAFCVEGAKMDLSNPIEPVRLC